MMADDNGENDDDSLPRSGVRILMTTGSFASSTSGDEAGDGRSDTGIGIGSRSVSSFAASDDDGLGTELSGLQFVSEELQREIANVSADDVLVPPNDDDDDDESELPKTPSRTLVIGTIPDSSESGGSSSHENSSQSTPDRLVDTYTADFDTPLRAGGRGTGSESGSGSGSDSEDSAIAELRSIANDSRSGSGAGAGAGVPHANFVTPPGDGESVVSASSASITGSYSIMRGVIPSPSVTSSRGSSPTKSLKSIARSLRSIGSKSSRGSKRGTKTSAAGSDFSDNDGGPGDAARKSSSTSSSPVRKLLSRSAALGAAAAGGVAAALTGKAAPTASTPAKSALSLGSGDIVHTGDTPVPSPKSFVAGDDVGREEEKEEADVEGGGSSAGEVAAGITEEGNDVPEKAIPAEDDTNQMKMFVCGCACLSVVLLILLAVGLSLGFTRSADTGAPPSPTMPPVTRRPTRAPAPSSSAPVTAVPTSAPSSGIPTVSPETAEPTAFGAERYIKDITPDPVALETPGTPQNLAYKWLLSQENVDSLTPTEVEQQYSLATIFYSLGGEDVEELDGWLNPNTPECEWFGVECVNPAPQSRQAAGNEGGVVVKLELAEVGLAGEIPREILLLKDLTDVLLYGNNLSGSIPADLYNLTNLEILELDRNSFSGSIASDIGNLQSLRILRLDHNAFSGSLPDELGRINSLQKIRLDTNRFTGIVPSYWGFLSGAETIMLHRNYIVGEVPLALCLLTFDRLNTLSSDCSSSGGVRCICCTLCSTGYPESSYNPYTSWQGYPPEDPQQKAEIEDGGSEILYVDEDLEVDLAGAMNKAGPRFPTRKSKHVERHEIRRDVFVRCSWVTKKSSEKEKRCKKMTVEGALLSELCPSQCS